uniref:Uncharacterized protein n=1 Tax=Chromera velia CCMP2878 TaxID=1169474 RepID=A0A0G4GK39_9ALVE|eukprot:Cvel_4815.t1-p1 / transcript=Cvel_4815.t1 / gene=Cvel_4815 / organism=Chromera_velia_CCMP2878 / gene_product=hypothetical protein / transcript_product=hypothetical protein / location=Cvel_scaffold216:77386-81640(-) / protein_length=462 / sequence_SO=supercontig / SO=protein_coding / is_pseudo=false
MTGAHRRAPLSLLLALAFVSHALGSNHHGNNFLGPEADLLYQEEKNRQNVLPLSVPTAPNEGSKALMNSELDTLRDSYGTSGPMQVSVGPHGSVDTEDLSLVQMETEDREREAAGWNPFSKDKVEGKYKLRFQVVSADMGEKGDYYYKFHTTTDSAKENKNEREGEEACNDCRQPEWKKIELVEFDEKPEDTWFFFEIWENDIVGDDFSGRTLGPSGQKKGGGCAGWHAGEIGKTSLWSRGPSRNPDDGNSKGWYTARLVLYDSECDDDDEKKNPQYGKRLGNMIVRIKLDPSNVERKDNKKEEYGGTERKQTEFSDGSGGGNGAAVATGAGAAAAAGGGGYTAASSSSSDSDSDGGSSSSSEDSSGSSTDDESGESSSGAEAAAAGGGAAAAGAGAAAGAEPAPAAAGASAGAGAGQQAGAQSAQGQAALGGSPSVHSLSSVLFLWVPLASFLFSHTRNGQ